MHALGCFLAILFGLFFFIASAFVNIWRTAFGSQQSKRDKPWQTGDSSQSEESGSNTKPPQSRRKLFEDDEGEYVDFVEVKN